VILKSEIFTELLHPAILTGGRGLLALELLGPLLTLEASLSLFEEAASTTPLDPIIVGRIGESRTREGN